MSEARPPELAAVIGIDWADQKHDISSQSAQCQALSGSLLSQRGEG